jgi:hypothetical protein
LFAWFVCLVLVNVSHLPSSPLSSLVLCSGHTGLPRSFEPVWASSF